MADMVVPVYVNGTLKRKWNYTTRTYTEYADDGTVAAERPFNDEENARADAVAAQDAEAAVAGDLRTLIAAELGVLRESIGPATAAPAVTSLNGIINTPNADINANPARYIVALARINRGMARLLLRAVRLAVRDLTAPAE